MYCVLIVCGERVRNNYLPEPEVARLEPFAE